MLEKDKIVEFKSKLDAYEKFSQYLLDVAERTQPVCDPNFEKSIKEFDKMGDEILESFAALGKED